MDLNAICSSDIIILLVMCSYCVNMVCATFHQEVDELQDYSSVTEV